MFPGLSRQWKHYTQEHQDPPSICQLLAFIERQKKSAPDNRLSSSFRAEKHRSKGQLSTRKMVLKMQESPKARDHKDKCSYCDDSHAVFFLYRV